MFKYILLIINLLLWVNVKLYAQEQQLYDIKTIAFYNVENLFDTINNPSTFDDDRTPKGKYRWNTASYLDKIEKLAFVINAIGQPTAKNAPDIIGLAEIENRTVIEDLVNHPLLSKNNYSIIHFDSPDERGIDVALLYNPDVFIPETINKRPLYLYNNDGYRNHTRDQLVVTGYLNGDIISLIINHWPSRSGGVSKTVGYRKSAALLNKRIIDSIQRYNPDAKIISMGDLNDNPNDRSLKKILRTSSNKKDTLASFLYNPMEKLYKKGIGSLAYRDKWHLFDQFFFTSTLLDRSQEGYFFWKAEVYKPGFLSTVSGRYKGYPFRSYSGGNYTAGYSDHFPVYMHLLQRITRE